MGSICRKKSDFFSFGRSIYRIIIVLVTIFIKLLLFLSILLCHNVKVKIGEFSGIFLFSNQVSIPSNWSILKAYFKPEYNNPSKGGTQELASGVTDFESPGNSFVIIGAKNQKIMKLTIKIKDMQMHDWLKHTNLQHFAQLWNIYSWNFEIA